MIFPIQKVLYAGKDIDTSKTTVENLEGFYFTSCLAHVLSVAPVSLSSAVVHFNLIEPIIFFYLMYLTNII